MYVAGSTSSLAFPTTPGALQATSPANTGFTGYAGFVLKLAADGRSLAWSTYLGGNGGNTFFSGITADSASNAVWVAGTTGGGSNFPLSADGQQRVFGGGSYGDAYHQLDAATGALKYGSYLGGSGNDDALALAVDGSGNAYIAGNTDSRNLTVTANAFQPAYTANATTTATTTVLPHPGQWDHRIGVAALRGRRWRCHLAYLDRCRPAARCHRHADRRRRRRGARPGHLVAADGSSAMFGFSLEGAAASVYDLRVSNADGSSFTRKSAFTVGAAGGPGSRRRSSVARRSAPASRPRSPST